jgi:hypothetical protein
MFQHPDVENFALDPKMRSNEDVILAQTKSQNGFVQNNYESLDDIMNEMIKQVREYFFCFIHLNYKLHMRSFQLFQSPFQVFVL